MVVLHSFYSLLMGFLVMTVIVAVMTALLTRLVPEWAAREGRPQPGYVVVNLGYSFLASAAGGYVTALLAQGNPLVQVLVLAIVVLALGALSPLMNRGKQPVSYALSLLAIGPLGVLAGGLVRLRVLGIL